MKINKQIYNAFPNFTKSYNKLIVESFVHLLEHTIAKNESTKQELADIVAKDHVGGMNKFFCSDIFTVNNGSWLGRLVQPGKYMLNNNMWWFATGWIRCRNQILNGNNNLFVYNQKTQKCFVGLIEVHEKTIIRMKKHLSSIDVNLTDEQLIAFHNDLVQHYLKNQDVIIKDDLND